MTLGIAGLLRLQKVVVFLGIGVPLRAQGWLHVIR